MSQAALPVQPLQAAPEPADGFDPFADGAIERVYTTSEAQREVWLADRLGREASLAFNESVRLELAGAIDRAALQRALDQLVQRHDVLRATVSPDGGELLIAPADTLTLRTEDLRGIPPDAQARALADAADAAVQQPFDLERGPLWRAGLLQLADDRHVLLMTAHHIVCDGWSWGVLAEDLGALYAEQTGQAPAPDPAPSYGDYVAWEAREAAGPDMEAHRSFWRARFAGTALPVLQLPTDRLRPAVRRFESRRVDHVLDAALVAALRKLGSQAGASLFATLFAGFAALLARLAEQDDLVIGVPAAGQSASGMDRLVGHCVNLLPVRTPIDPAAPFRSALKQTAGLLLDAFDHQTLTYGSLLKELPIARDPSRLPLVSVMFNVDPAVGNVAGAFPGATATLTGNPRRFENFELFVNAVLGPHGARLECQYSSALYDGETIVRWLRLYEALLRAAVADPDAPLDRMPWLDARERAALHALQPIPTPAPTPALMHARVLRQCALTPERAALRCGPDALSYRALDERSNRLARALRQRGVGRGQRVGICLPRGVDMVVALLASLKAGAAYVPLDPGFPSQRLAFYAADAGLALLLTDTRTPAAPRGWREDAEARTLRLDGDAAWLALPADPLAPSDLDAGPRDAAYVIYTSGSTGTPKGVEVPHAAVANFLHAMASAPGIGPDDRLAAVTTLSFDIAVLELLLPLCVGAQAVLVPRDTLMDAELLGGLLASSGATLMQATPGVWRMLVDAGWTPTVPFRALVGGESLPPDLAVALAGRMREVWNLYGPTETTVWSTAWKVDPAVLADRAVSIGRPIDNTTVWVRDRHGEPCPIGVPGELCIGGAGLAIGYAGRPDLTAERFVPDAFSATAAAADGARLYRTGDRGRWRNDGTLEHLGRLDHQVKVRGYRIELGEIEAACEAIDGIGRCVVLTREPTPGDVRLVAYVETADPARDWAAAVRDVLPQHVVVVGAWPLLPNGKLDRNSLPAPATVQTPTGDAPAPTGPRSATESAVAGAMESVLSLPGLRLHDDFFRLGGHSLLAARLVSRLNQSLGIRLPLRCVFEAPTIAGLAAAIDALSRSNAPARPPVVFSPQRREAPLTLSQERIRFVEQLHPGRVTYNTPSGHRLRGPMDRQAFEAAFREVVRRQPSLRTRVQASSSDEGHLQIVEDAPDFDVDHHDLTHLPPAAREPAMREQMQALVDRPFDIHRAPLFRVALYRLGAEDHGFFFMPHHVVFDGWSFDLFYDEMAAAYGALLRHEANPMPPLQASHGDYAQWQRQWLGCAEYEAQLRYWKERFLRLPRTRAVEPDFARQSGMSGTGGAQWLEIGPALTVQLRALARDCDATLNMVTMAVFSALLTRLVHGDSVALGVPVRGRPVPEFETVMGYFGNLLPVAMTVQPEQPFEQLVRQVKAELLDVFSNQDVPFERLSLEPEVARRTQGAGLYQALFSYQDARDRPRRWGALQHETIVLFQNGATEDIGLWLMELPDRLEGGLIYNADLFRPETAQAVLDRFLALLHRVVQDRAVGVRELTADDGSAASAWLRERAVHGAAAATDGRPADAAAGPQGATPGRQAALNPSERALAAIWAGLLHVDIDDIGANDGFFDLGGDSLLAMRAVDQVAKQLGVRVEPRRYLFENLGQLAAGMAAALPTDAAHAADPGAAAPRGALGRMLSAFKRRGA